MTKNNIPAKHEPSRTRYTLSMDEVRAAVSNWLELHHSEHIDGKLTAYFSRGGDCGEGEDALIVTVEHTI